MSMRNSYYYLVLPNEKVNFEAIEEVFREQEAYEKKFSNFSSRSGYVFSKNNINKLPNIILEDITSSNFFKNLKMDAITSINARSLISQNFTIFVSLDSILGLCTTNKNKDFISLTLCERILSKGLTSSAVKPFFVPNKLTYCWFIVSHSSNV